MGQALIGAALNRRSGADRVAKLRKVKGSFIIKAEQTPRLQNYKNNLFLQYK